MATVVDELITRYTLDPSGYVQGANKVKKATKSAKDDHSDFMKDLDKGFQSFAGPVSAAASVIGTFATTVVAAGAALLGLGVMASRSAADFDALIQALAAVDGGLDNAKKRYQELYKIAQAPGAGPMEALQGYLLLRRSELSPEFSKKLIKEFANLNAGAGGGRAELERLLLVTSQIAASGKVHGQDLMQFMQAGIPMGPMMKRMYGTADPEEIGKKGVTSLQFLQDLEKELEKTARVGDSAKNAWENLDAEVEMAVKRIGMGINSDLMSSVSSFTAAVTDLNESGITEEFGRSMVAQFDLVMESITGEGGLETALIGLGGWMISVAGAVRNLTLNLKTLWEEWEDHRRVMRGEKKGTKDVSGDDFSPFAEGQRFVEQGQMDLELMRMKRKRAEEEAKKKGEAGKKDEGLKGDKAHGLLQQIAENTQPLLDMKRMALGGGPLGRNAISPIELGGMRSPNRHVAQIVAGVIGLMQPSMIDALKSRS